MRPQHLWHLCTYTQYKHLCHQLKCIMKCLRWTEPKLVICTDWTKSMLLAKAVRVLSTAGQLATHSITQQIEVSAIPAFVMLNNPASAPALPFSPRHIFVPSPLPLTGTHPLTGTDEKDCSTCCWLCSQVIQLPTNVWLSAYSYSSKTQVSCYLTRLVPTFHHGHWIFHLRS